MSERSFPLNTRGVFTLLGRAALAVSLSLLFAHIARAQSASGLTGVVLDPSALRLANVKVTVQALDTGDTRSLLTNAEGEYSVAPLQPGRYEISAELPGFQRYSQKGITLELGRVARIDITLQVGHVSESVDVVAENQLIESETATVGQFIENKTVRDMPINGRRVGDLLKLMGNAVYITGDVIRPRVTVAGSRGDQQQWLLDGVNASNVALEIPQALFNPPVESVQEVRVQQNNYSAEFGNTAGGVVSVITRSGTNQFHGSAYEFFRNDAMDARNFFSAQKAPLRYNIFGLTAGGPIIKNKTFFFSSNEWQIQRIGLTRVYTVPTAAQKAGDFSQTLTAAGALVPIYDPATTRVDPANPTRTIRDPFVGNIIPSNRLDPVGAKIAGYYPAATRAAANLAGANNFARNGSTNLNLTTWTTKVDHILNDNSRLGFRMVLHNFPTDTAATFDNPAADPDGSITTRRAYSFLGTYTRNFGSRAVNDFRFNYQPRRFRQDTLSIGGNWPAQLGLKGVTGSAFPQVTASGYVNLGAGTQQRIQTPIRDTDIVDVYSLLLGKHSIKIGGEARFGQNQDDLNSLTSGSIGFGPQLTALSGTTSGGNAIASLLLGAALSGKIQDTDILDRRAAYYAAFVQDDWKVTRSFTLNLGVRWETHTPRVDENNRQNSFDTAKINPVSGTPGVVTFAGRDGLGSKVYNSDYVNFGPRIGFAWKPSERRSLVVRSGYGVYFGPPVPGSNTASAGFETSGDYSSPDSGNTAAFLLSNGFPATVPQVLNSGFGAVAVGSAVRLAPVYIGQDRALGYSQQWNFSVQQELKGNIVAEVSYLGNVGHKLPAPDTSINQVRPELLLGAGSAQTRRPFPQFGNVTLLTPMWGNSSYHGLNVKVEKRFSNGLNFLTNYTWSKFIDDVASSFEVGAVPSGYQDFYNRRADKSLAGNDVRNRLAVSSVYELPWGRGRKLLNRGLLSNLVGGWNLGAILIAQAGSPFGLVTQTNTSNSFNPGPQRVNVLKDPSLPAEQRSVARWFDTTAVAAPAAYTFGNSSRALLTGPGLLNLDISLLKNFRFKETGNVQFRAESLNVANHTNFQAPGRSLGAANFGAISSALPARVMQLGLKVEF
ncbi:carboxypeptidase regulatory-like domain-containing protein [Paludibaculum fermentans]|uniref:TonB-dependent receptor n=1 Tax=Paludibaculum fermentans TaxID=1473598 RepID=UPI003EBB6C61